MSDDTPRIDEIMAARIGRALAGESTPDEEARIAEWRAADPANEREYRTLVRLWESTAPARTVEVPPVDEAWARMRARVAEEAGRDTGERGRDGRASEAAEVGGTPRGRAAPTHRPRVHHRPRARRQWGLAVAVAAGVALLIGLPLLRSTAVESTLRTIAVAPGASESVTLADGSTVQVGAGSSLTFPDRFDPERRLVRMEGEAEFDVEPGERPFVVETASSRVTVLGTRFTVHEVEGTTYLSVTEGRVRIESLSEAGLETEVGAGEGVVLDGGLRTLDPAETEAVSGWIAGGLVFASTPVGDVVDLLRRRSGWSIELGPAVDPGTRITLDLGGLTIEEAAALLAEVLGMAATPRPDESWLIG